MQPSKGPVLCTENNADDRELLECVLTNEGFEVVATADPVEALELVQSGGFNLYILDVRMPHISGFELCKKLRRSRYSNPHPLFHCCGF